MKAMLIIDKPTNCMECPCFSYDLEEDWIGNTICNITGKEIEVVTEENEDGWLHYKAKKTPSYYHCPLKPMPNKAHIFDIYKEYPFTTEEEQKAYLIGNEDGYNDCINEILGEE